MQLPSSPLRPTTWSDEKLCLSNVVEQYRLELLHQAVPNNENIHLYITVWRNGGRCVCHAATCNWRQVHKNNISGKRGDYTDYKQTICGNLNPPELMSDGGMDYTWHTDDIVHDITCEDIQKLGAGSIGRLDISAPCICKDSHLVQVASQQVWRQTQESKARSSR